MSILDIGKGMFLNRPRARVVNTAVPLASGLLTTVSNFGLLAPVAFAKTGGSSNLTINASTGAISAAAALTAGQQQSLTGTATGADGVVFPFTANLTGAVLLNALSLSVGTATTGNLWSATINGATAGSTITATSTDGTILTVSGTTVSGTFTSAGTPTITLTETLASASNSGRQSTSSLTVTLSPTLAGLSLSASSFTIGSPGNGTILGATAGSTISASGLPAGLTINGAARTWAYDGSGSAATTNITLTETLAGATNTPRSSTISVTIGAGAPFLGVLGMSSTTFVIGTPSNGTITGATAGSTIAASGLPAGVTINSAARTWAYDGSGSATSGSLTLTESLAGASNTPRASTINFTVSAGGPVLNELTLSAYILGALSMSSNTFTIGQPSGGSIAGATPGSTITASGLPSGLTINSAARTWAYDGSGSPGVSNVTLTETLAGATNTPRNSSVTATVAAGVPAAPTVTLTPGNTQVSIAYSANATNGAAITEYRLYAGASAGALSLVGTIPAASASPYLDTGLTNGVARFYALSAVNSAGEGPQSAVQSATPTGAPVTTNYTYAQIGNGLSGGINFNTPAGRNAFLANSTTTVSGFWAGRITGTDADILIYNGSGTSQPAGLVEVSIDGAAFTSAPIVGGRYVLFSGLPHATRNVVVRIQSAYGGGATIPNTGNVMTVTGTPPSVSVGSTAVQVGEDNSNIVTTTNWRANGIGGTWTPARWTNNTTTAGMTIRGNPSELLIATPGRYVYVSVDGAAPTRYDLGSATNDYKLLNIPGLSGTRTYYIWAGGFQRPAHFTVGFVGGSVVDITTKRRMDQFGDSITSSDAGSPTIPTSQGESEVFRVAASLGYMGGNFGQAGDTVTGLNNRLDAILAAKVGTSAVGPDDVAILAIGRNNAGAAFDATVTAAYQSIVNKLLTAGYRRVICRGILPETGFPWLAANESIRTIAEGFADVRVKHLPVATWTGIATSDGVHPTDAGYGQLASLAAAAYPALIA